jgi:hypothetical protein
MTVVVTVYMIAVTGIEMMVVVIAIAVLMDTAQTVSLLHMLILSAKSARNMVTPPMHVGGAIEMTRRTKMMVRKEQILRHMVLIPIGTLIQVPLIISRESWIA